ncbi:hypothetical protein NTD86_09305 [Pseudomonas sp. 7P_10.2_Bac1]|uniref:hypothetical protein n=1 Tax=Pseudomonas sp. 7P_10.2_Bac1 TaxID=2971614 RepID=UPI0021C8B829|nr:hypothetical protein [Pseudomonas sp. 7P_10.2_Bac1]MCU1727179.1 hypothetical protein [Pseudomonas sp. 7P_10.2_Bac1]
MADPLEINISKSFVNYGGKQWATYESGGGVTVQIWKDQQLELQRDLSYAEYATFREKAPELGLRDYPDPTLRRHGGTNANGNTIGRVVGETAPAAVPATQANPPIEAETEEEQGWWKSASPWVHGGLDVLGFVPGLGAFPDLINAVFFALEGDLANARLSALAAIPFAGDALKGGVLVGKGINKAGAHTGKELAEGSTSTLGKNSINPPPPTERSGGRFLGNEKCILRTYRPNKCAKGLIGHHVVPDRAFRLGGRENKIRDQIPGGLSEANGLVICVNSAQHIKIHNFYDKAETALGLTKNPPGIANLLELETLGAAAASKFTGCKKGLLQAQLRAHHEFNDLGPSFKVRADKNGNLSRKAPPGSLGQPSNGDF